MNQAIFISTPDGIATSPHATSPNEVGGGLSEQRKLREGVSKLREGRSLFHEFKPPSEREYPLPNVA